MTNSATEFTSSFGKLLWRSKSRGNQQVSEDTQITPRQMNTTCFISFSKPHSANPNKAYKLSHTIKKNMQISQNKIFKGLAINKRASCINPLELHSVLQVKQKDTFTFISAFYPNKCDQKKRMFFKARLSNSSSSGKIKNEIEFTHAQSLAASSKHICLNKKPLHTSFVKTSVTSHKNPIISRKASRFTLHIAKSYEMIGKPHNASNRIMKHILLSNAMKTRNKIFTNEKSISLLHSPMLRNRQAKYRYSFEDWKRHKEWVQNHKAD